MSRTVLTAGLLSVAALGLGIVSAQAAPSAPLMSGLTNHVSGSVENVNWRGWRWHRYHRWHHHRHYRWW